MFTYVITTSSPPQSYFLGTICRAKNDPPVTKFGYGLILGCRSALGSERDPPPFFGDVETKNGHAAYQTIDSLDPSRNVTCLN